MNEEGFKEFVKVLMKAVPRDLDDGVYSQWVKNPLALAETLRKALDHFMIPAEYQFPYFAVPVEYDMPLWKMINYGFYTYIDPILIDILKLC